MFSFAALVMIESCYKHLEVNEWRFLQAIFSSLFDLLRVRHEDNWDYVTRLPWGWRI